MSAAKDSGRLPVFVAAGSVVLAAGLVAVVLVLRSEAARAEKELAGAIRDYRDMERLKREIEEQKKKHPKGPTPGPETGGDMLSFLSSKARQANLPPGVMNIAPNPPTTSGGWKETSHSVTLRAPPNETIPRAAIVDFITRVEDERPSIRSRDLSLDFSGDNFRGVTVKFSQFQSAQPPGPK